MERKNDDESRKKVLDLIGKVDLALFGTREGGTGRMHARPMAYQGHDGEHLWFFTKRDSRKVREISANPETLLCFSDPGHQTYVSVTGETDVVADRAKIKELWNEIYRTWFPKGSDDPDIVLLRVAIDHAEYWDVASSVMVHAYGYLKALATGKPPHPGDVGEVSFT